MRNRMRGLPQIFFEAEGASGGGGGDASAGAAAPAASASAGSSSSQSSADAAGAAAPSQSGAEGAAAAGQQPAAPSIYRPEGLPDHMVGKTDQETIDNMKKALDGYRQRDADAKVPDDPKAYADFAADVPEPIKPHLETLRADPLFDRVAETAAKLRLPVPVFQELTQAFLSSSAEMGLLEPPIDVAAERAALTPEAAKHLPEAEQKVAREKRMSENFAFLDALSQRQDGGVSKDVADYAKAMLGDSAKGHQFIEFLRSTMAGGAGPAMNLNGTGAGGDARAELQRRASLPENNPSSPKFNRASYDQLQADYQRLFS